MNNKKLKKYKNVMKERTYTLKEVTDLITINAQQHANDQLFDYLACVSIVLRDELGFGKQRLEKFHRRVAEQVQCIRDDSVKPEEMFFEIHRETKFDFGSFHSKLLKEMVKTS